MDGLRFSPYLECLSARTQGSATAAEGMIALGCEQAHATCRGGDSTPFKLVLVLGQSLAVIQRRPDIGTFVLVERMSGSTV